MDQLINDRLENYLENLVPPRSAQMQAMEAYARETHFPILGPACGNLCYLITRLSGARKVFELGSGYGYSTAWFARGVQENGGGVVFHTVWDQDLSRKAQFYLAQMGYGDIVQYRVGEAVQALRETQGPFDLIFNDIEKEGYPAALPVIQEKLRPGGALIADNLLWHGRIFDTNDHTAATEAIRRFTQQITTDPGWMVSLAPIRDGLLIAVKK